MVASHRLRLTGVTAGLLALLIAVSFHVGSTGAYFSDDTDVTATVSSGTWAPPLPEIPDIPGICIANGFPHPPGLNPPQVLLVLGGPGGDLVYRGTTDGIELVDPQPATPFVDLSDTSPNKPAFAYVSSQNDWEVRGTPQGDCMIAAGPGPVTFLGGQSDGPNRPDVLIGGPVDDHLDAGRGHGYIDGGGGTNTCFGKKNQTEVHNCASFNGDDLTEGLGSSSLSEPEGDGVQSLSAPADDVREEPADDGEIVDPDPQPDDDGEAPPDDDADSGEAGDDGDEGDGDDGDDAPADDEGDDGGEPPADDPPPDETDGDPDDGDDTGEPPPDDDQPPPGDDPRPVPPGDGGDDDAD